MGQEQMAAFVDGIDDDYDELYGVIEEQMQPKVEPYKRQELMAVVPLVYSISKVNSMDERKLFKKVVTMVLTIF